MLLFAMNKSNMKFVLSCLILIAASATEISGAETLGVGLGFGGSSRPYTDALQRLRDNGVTVLKTWNINPDWLDAVQSVFSDVSFRNPFL